eukprot:Awhi_evm1s7295
MSGFPCTAQIFIGSGECNTPAAVNVVIPDANCVATKLTLTGLGAVDGSVKIAYNAATNSYKGTAYALSANCQGAISFPLDNENGVCETVDVSKIPTLSMVVGQNKLTGKITSKSPVKAARSAVEDNTEDEEGSASYAMISVVGA